MRVYICARVPIGGRGAPSMCKSTTISGSGYALYVTFCNFEDRKHD